VRLQPQLTETLKLCLSPRVIDGEKIFGRVWSVVPKPVRITVGERNDPEVGMGDPAVDKRALDHEISFIVRARISCRFGPEPVGRLDLDLPRVRVGNADDEQITSCLAGQEIFHVPDVERLKSSVYHANFH
jgi:hypothetical protein